MTEHIIFQLSVQNIPRTISDVLTIDDIHIILVDSHTVFITYTRMYAPICGYAHAHMRPYMDMDMRIRTHI